MKRLPAVVVFVLLCIVAACGEIPTRPTAEDGGRAAPVRYGGDAVPFAVDEDGEPQDLLGHDNGRHKIIRIDTTTAIAEDVGLTGFSTGYSAMATSRAPVAVNGGVTYPAGTHFGVMRISGVEWVLVVDTEDGHATKIVQIRDIPARGAAFGPDGSTLFIITLGYEPLGNLYTVDMFTGELTPVRPTKRSNALAWDPDAGQFVATYGGYLWHISPSSAGSDTRLALIGIIPCTVARAPDGTWFTVDGGKLYQLDLDSGKVKSTPGRGIGSICGSAFAPQRTVDTPPTAAPGGPYTGTTDSHLDFDGYGWDEDTGEIASSAYHWEFGDGSSGTGDPISHTYSSPGTYTVTLTVTDPAGISASASTTATIEEGQLPPENTVPQVILNDDVTTSHGQLFETDAVFNDPDAGSTWTWTLDWGDGSDAATGPGTPGEHMALSHQFPDEPGSWTITFTVNDGAGGIGQDQQVLTFTNTPPNAVLGFHPFIEGENICTYLEGGQACIHGGDSWDDDVLDDENTLTFFFEYSAAHATEAYTEWEQTGVGGQPPFVYADNGTYQVTLTVSDNWASDTDTKPVTILNVAPAVGVRDGGTVELGNAFELGAGFKDPGTRDAPWTWTIDWGDESDPESGSTNTQGKGAIQSTHMYDALGTFTVTVCVTDKDGDEGCKTTTVEVVDTTPPTITWTGNEGTYSVTDEINIICTAADSGSGLASDTCRDFTGPAWSFGVGETSYTATATDNADNTASATVTFTVELTYDGLCALVRQFVDHHGIANSLCVKLNASAKAKNIGSHNGPLEAFISEVEAQTDKKIKPEHAAILIAMATSLKW